MQTKYKEVFVKLWNGGGVIFEIYGACISFCYVLKQNMGGHFCALMIVLWDFNIYPVHRFLAVTFLQLW